MLIRDFVDYSGNILFLVQDILNIHTSFLLGNQ